jgi:hypothetical protein
MRSQPVSFEVYEIRRVFEESTETSWYSIVDIIQALTQQQGSKVLEQVQKSVWARKAAV